MPRVSPHVYLSESLSHQLRVRSPGVRGDGAHKTLAKTVEGSLCARDGLNMRPVGHRTLVLREVLHQGIAPVRYDCFGIGDNSHQLAGNALRAISTIHSDSVGQYLLLLVVSQAQP